jgi:hypothetical protein
MNLLLAAATDSTVSVPTAYIAVLLGGILSTTAYVAKQAVAQARINERVATLLDDHGKRLDRVEDHLWFSGHPASLPRLENK